MMETSMTSLPSPEECRSPFLYLSLSFIVIDSPPLRSPGPLHNHRQFNLFLRFSLFHIFNDLLRRSTRRRRRLPEIPKDKRREFLKSKSKLSFPILTWVDVKEEMKCSNSSSVPINKTSRKFRAKKEKHWRYSLGKTHRLNHIYAWFKRRNYCITVIGPAATTFPNCTFSPKNCPRLRQQLQFQASLRQMENLLEL